MVTVGERTEGAVDHRYQIADKQRIIGSTESVELTPVIAAAGILDVAAFHDNDHGHTFLFGYLIIEDIVHVALCAPSRLIFAEAVL